MSATGDLRRSERGFTLLELLVAFVIAAGTIQLAFMVLGGQSRQVATSADVQTAIVLAENALAAIEGEGRMAPGSLNGTSDTGLQWTARITEAPASGNGSHDNGALYRIELDVQRRVDGDPILEMVTYRVAHGPRGG